jgi:putative membrane protein
VRKLVLYWLTTAASLALVDYLFAGVRFTSLIALAVGALVLGFVNALVRPVLTLLTLPATILTLGLFYLVVNGLAFAIAAAFVPGFRVSGLGTAIAAALLTSVISTALAALLKSDE